MHLFCKCWGKTEKCKEYLSYQLECYDYVICEYDLVSNSHISMFSYVNEKCSWIQTQVCAMLWTPKQKSDEGHMPPKLSDAPREEKKWGPNSSEEF